MRKILTPPGRLLALVARRPFPFLLRVDPFVCGTPPTNSVDTRRSDRHAPQTNREFAEAAIRMFRTLC